jgi:hypothetical protein
MGYDILTWNPHISHALPYDFSGSTRLDGVLDPGPPSFITAGDSTGYSSPPNFSQVVAGTGINQIIALINWMASQYIQGGSFTYMSYLSQHAKVKASDITNIQTNINTLRALQGRPSYTFTYTPTAHRHILGAHVAELRKAMRINGTITLKCGLDQSGINADYVRTDQPYGSPLSEGVDGVGGINKNYGASIFFGGSNNSLGALFWVRHRWTPQVYIPAYLSVAPNNVQANFNMQTITNSSFGELASFEIFLSSFDDHGFNLSPAYGGYAYNLDNLLGSFASTGPLSFGFGPDQVAARAANYLSFIIGEVHELTGTGTSFGFDTVGGNAQLFNLTMDYGL